MPLTDSIARNAKPTAKTVRMFDRDGLYSSPSVHSGSGSSGRETGQKRGGCSHILRLHCCFVSCIGIYKSRSADRLAVEGLGRIVCFSPGGDLSANHLTSSERALGAHAAVSRKFDRELALSAKETFVPPTAVPECGHSDPTAFALSYLPSGR
jgi:hypothetical protein